MSLDLVIVGAGPAGVSAALWARSRHLDAQLLESSSSPGGQLLHVNFAPRDLPGVRGVSGPALAKLYADQLREAAVPVRYGTAAASIDTGDPQHPVVVMASGERCAAQAVLIASGARRRRLEVPGEREFEDRGVSYSATRDLDALRGSRVAMVGGGDSAYENALILTAAGCEVELIVRGAPRARREFSEHVAADSRIRVRERTRVVAMLGAARVEAIAVDGPDGEQQLPIEAVVIKVGELPNSEWCRGAVALDPEGFVVVDARYRTSRPRVWAAGDVMRPALSAIAVAIGAAALAVGDIRAELKGR